MANRLEIDFSQMRRLTDTLAVVPKDLNEYCREFSANVAEKVRSNLNTAIDSSFPANEGHLKSWQESQVGSRMRYAAVRAKGEPSMKGKYRTAYITNALNSGHKTRSPSGTSKRPYNPKPGLLGRVPGKKFYEAAFKVSLPYVNQQTKELSRKIAERLRKVSE